MFAPQFLDIKYVFQALIEKARLFSTRRHKNFFYLKTSSLISPQINDEFLVSPSAMFYQVHSKETCLCTLIHQESTCFFPMSDIQFPLYIKELTSSQNKSNILISLWETYSTVYHFNGPCLHQITGYHHIFFISIQKNNTYFSQH